MFYLKYKGKKLWIEENKYLYHVSTLRQGIANRFG